MRNIGVRDAPCWDQNSERVKCFDYKLLLRTCIRFECKTATDSARVRTRAANAYTKRGIENSFPGTQMFVQARNKNCLQQICLNRFCVRFDPVRVDRQTSSISWVFTASPT